MAGGDSVTNFVIGIFVSLAASFLDALGLNILKLDHVKEAKRETDKQRNDCGRPLWHIGLYTYIGSQLIGSTIALNYLKTQWVAPLGSVALIYNFIFAKILVNTKITRKDVLGTCVVVASVIWIVVFGGMYNGEDPEETISLENLKTLFMRPIFIIYFSALNILTISGLLFALWSRWALADSARKRRNPLFSGMTDKQMRRLIGLMFSLEGGMLASETLLLAKSGVKLFTLSISSQVNQFTDSTSRFVILALLVTAVLQVYCLNSALKLYSSVVVVPVFYGCYTALGLVNTIIYLDEISQYPGWAITLVFCGIGVLIYGVFLLSSKPDPSHPTETADMDQEMNVLNTTDGMADTTAWPSAKEEKEAMDARFANGTTAIPPHHTFSGESSASQSLPPDNESLFIDSKTRTSPSAFTRWLYKLKIYRNATPDPPAPFRSSMNIAIPLMAQTRTGTGTGTNDSQLPAHYHEVTHYSDIPLQSSTLDTLPPPPHSPHSTSPYQDPSSMKP